MTYALQTLTDKVYMGNVVSGVNAADTIAMGEIVFGGREAMEKTPVSISLINCNSPLRWDDRMLDAQFEYCAAGQPVVLTPFLLMGAMSPVTIRCIVSKSLSARKQRCCVEISYRMMPSENTSLRRSTSRPRHCSGAMYANLPLMMPD